jgi:CheY-like chemotaxis protein
MAGEPILVVDDTPVNLKLTRILLVNEGYKVMTATTAEEALELLKSFHPHLVLTDIQLPGMDGLELTRRIRQDPGLKDLVVVALTAFAMKGDEQKAIDAGCDGYITKPIDTRTLGTRLREHLGRRNEAPASPPKGEAPAVPEADMQGLRRTFLAEGRDKSRQLLLDMDGAFSASNAAKLLHQWVGTGGLLGYSAISRLAREAEAILLERPLDNAQLRESLTALALAFSSPREARDVPIPEYVSQALAGKQVTVVGLPVAEEERLGIALDRAHAESTFFEASCEPTDPDALAADLAVIFVAPEVETGRWLDADAPVWKRTPVVLVGGRDHLLALDPQVQSRAREFLMDAWQPEEALVRLSLALIEKPAVKESRIPPPPQPVAGTGRARVVIADDDPTVRALVTTTLKNFGFETEAVPDGTTALETIRRTRPDIAVLDVSMPGMDGYEVLAALRNQSNPVRVMLLTARQQESDVIRGFSLGADDYVVKPFSPMELVARLKRLGAR